MRRFATFLIPLFLACPAPSSAAEPGQRPNIVVIMADDMGFSDIGCYGGEILTPTLDGLAARGLRFTQFYNTGRCCPTRATLLSGVYAHQAGVGHMMEDRGLEGYRGQINRRCRTIAEVLRPAGYSTYMSGKWHVSPKIAPGGPKDNWPRARGFDRFFGTIHGAGSFYDPNSLTLDDEQIPPGRDDFFYTDAIADHAIRFVEEHDESAPFFLYVAFTSPHWPMHARPHNVAKYRGLYDIGWDELRRRRHARMIELGIVDAEQAITARDPGVPAWEDAPHKEWEARCMEVYAAMIDCMDQNIGRLVRTLEAKGALENTLIFFLADNGGCAEPMARMRNPDPRPTDPRELRPMRPAELQTRMIPTVTRDGFPVRQGRVMPGPADTYIGYGIGWANASNTPFRLYKHWVHEGGISSPLIVHWPKAIAPERRGGLVRTPAHLVDIMATCVDVGAATYPTEVDGRSIWPLAGTTLSPACFGREIVRARPIFWEHEGNRAMRDGRWKLVARDPRGPWELYDMEKDRTELYDLSEEQAARTRAMIEAWESWAVEANVKPWPWVERVEPRR